MGSISGKTVAITGAGSGIGNAIALRFMADGATVVASDLNEDGMSNLDGAITTRADVSSFDDVKAMVDLAVSETGKIDVLINNAGIAYAAPVAETDPARFALLHDVHVNGTLNGMRAALPHMIEQGSGHVLSVISRVAETETPGMSAYASAKAAMWALTRTAAAEVEESGVLVNMLFPGVSRTAMTEGGGLGDPSSLGAPDQQYDTFLKLATLDKGSPVGKVWFDGNIYPMFQDSNDLGDLQGDFNAGESNR